jgi:importin subunit alpha-2
MCRLHCSDGDTERIDAVVSCGAVRRVVELLASPSADVVAPAVRVIGNIVTGTATQTQAVLNCGSLQFLLPLLKCVRAPRCAVGPLACRN